MLTMQIGGDQIAVFIEYHRRTGEVICAQTADGHNVMADDSVKEIIQSYILSQLDKPKQKRGSANGNGKKKTAKKL